MNGHEMAVEINNIRWKHLLPNLLDPHSLRSDREVQYALGQLITGYEALSTLQKITDHNHTVLML